MSQNSPPITPSLKDYVFGVQLGRGTYGTVYKACKRGSLGRDLFAIKCVAKRTSKAASDNLISEITILKKIKHEFIVQLHDFQWDTFYIYLIFEYCDSGDLHKYLKERISLQEKHVKHFLQQLASALQVLHDNNIAHFDLKPQNILLTHRPDKSIAVKLADFGFAHMMESEEEMNSLRGSPLYMAPEILLKRKYDARVDLWSVGVILYECLYGTAPFASDTFAGLAEKIKSNKSIKIPSATTSRISLSCKDLLQRLLQRDPDKRILFTDFFKHPFLDLEHIPTQESYIKGVLLINEAICLDGRGELKTAYDKYVDALHYLIPVLTWGTGSPDFVKQREPFRDKVNGYVRRAEILKEKCNISNLSDKEESLLVRAYEDAADADLLAENGYADDALEKYRVALEVLVPMISKFRGNDKEAMYKQLHEWIEKAETIKITCDADRENSSKASHKSEAAAQAEKNKKSGPWVTLRKRSKKVPEHLKPMSPDDTFLPSSTCRVQ